MLSFISVSDQKKSNQHITKVIQVVDIYNEMSNTKGIYQKINAYNCLMYFKLPLFVTTILLSINKIFNQILNFDTIHCYKGNYSNKENLSHTLSRQGIILITRSISYRNLLQSFFFDDWHGNHQTEFSPTTGVFVNLLLTHALLHKSYSFPCVPTTVQLRVTNHDRQG